MPSSCPDTPADIDVLILQLIGVLILQLKYTPAERGVLILQLIGVLILQLKDIQLKEVS